MALCDVSYFIVPVLIICQLTYYYLALIRPYRKFDKNARCQSGKRKLYILANGGDYTIISYYYASRKRRLSHRLKGFRRCRVRGEGDGPVAIAVRLAGKCADTKKNAWNKSMREKDRVAGESVVCAVAMDDDDDDDDEDDDEEESNNEQRP
ncbi:hypothetical protein QTP88_009242 [Uroleucon formosanum]